MSLLALGAILATAAASSAASLYNNRQNTKNADDANRLSVYLANTAHQREVQDLEAAGLNPILSAGGSGASTPQLKTPNLESIDGGIGNSGMSIAKALNGQMDAELEMAEADAASAKAYADRADDMAQQELLEADARVRKAENDAESSDYQRMADSQRFMNENVDELARNEALTGNRSSEVDDLIKNKEGKDTYRNLVAQYRNEIKSGKYKSSLGRTVFQDVLSGASSAAGVYRATRGAQKGRTRR